MKFSDHITLSDYSQSARNAMNGWSERLDQTEKQIAVRMGDKTVGAIIGAMVGTIAWTVICVLFVNSFNSGDMGLLKTFGLIGIFLLAGVLLVDAIISINYYGKLQRYKNKISGLKSQLTIGRNSIGVHQDKLLASKENGWKFSFQIGKSISVEAITMESKIAGMETLKKETLPTIENVLYFIDAVLITIVFSIPLFESALELMNGILSAFAGPEQTTEGAAAYMWLGVLVACCVEILLAKIVWGKFDCSVNFLSVLTLLAGPILFLVTIILGTALVGLFVWAIALIIGIGALAIGVMCASATTNGG